MTDHDLHDVVIVSGPPGVGKTTVSRLLADDGIEPDGAAIVPAPTVHLESDHFYRFIRRGFVAPHLPEAHHQNVRLLSLVADTAATYSRNGHRVVLDGVVGPWMIDLIVGRLAQAGLGAHYLLLDLPPDVTAARVAHRDGTSEVGGAEMLARQFAETTGHDHHRIDGSGSAADVANRCRRAVAGGHHRLVASPWTDPVWPVSAKGVVVVDGRYVVLRNSRGEWELPGGRVEPGDASPDVTVRREVREELGIRVTVGSTVDSWFYNGLGGRVLILVHPCRPIDAGVADLVLSDEHTEIGLFEIDRLAEEPLPTRYLESLRIVHRLSPPVHRS